MHNAPVSGSRHRIEALAVLSIIAAALTVRVILLFDRAAYDPNFYNLVAGSDDYVSLAKALLNSEYAIAGTYWQPGNIVWLAFLISVFGADMWTLYAINMLTGVASVGAVTAAGWVAFGKRAGLIGGLVAALYPPLAFFHTTLQPATPAAALAAVAMLGGVWAVCRGSGWGAALFGAAAGLGALVRPTLLAFGPALFLALVVAREPAAAWRGWRRVAGLTVLAASFTVLTLAPQILANRAAGSGNLVSSSGPLNFYMGNNRDTDGTGINNPGQAWQVARERYDDWPKAFFKDLQADPGRMLALELRKLGLFWSNLEVANNVDYVAQGLDVSPLLRTLALNGRLGWTVLSWLAFTGFFLHAAEPGRGRKTPALWLLAGAAGLYMLGTAAFYILSRLRIPAAPLLCVAAGAAVTRTYGAIRTRRLDRALLGAGVSALALLLVFHAFERQLPRRAFYDSLPPGVFARDYNFGGEIKLVGMEAIESDHRPGGYAYVTLYWQAIAPPAEDYSVFVHLVDADGNKIAGHDERILGSITYPVMPTSRWPVGEILAESYLIELPEAMPAVVDVHAGVYHPETLARLPITMPDGAPTPAQFARISALGVAPPEGFARLDGEVTPVDLWFGDALRLTGRRIPAAARLGDTLEVELEWEATAPVGEDYTLFLHLFDAGMHLVSQYDMMALGPDLPTSAMVPGYPVGRSYTLDLPDDITAGEYLLRVGVYTYPSFDRLPIRDSEGLPWPDGVAVLATIHLE